MIITTMKTLVRMRKKSINELSRKDRICLYLKDHPEVLSQELMLYIATHIMNYGYVRKIIKDLYGQIVLENIQNNNFVIIPDHYESE